MTSIAARRRRKRARITLAGGQQIDQKPTGRDRVDVGQRKQAEDARRGPLEARLARGGILSAAEVEAASTALKSALQATSKDERKAKVRALAQKVDAIRRKKVDSDMFETDVGYCANYLLSAKEADDVVKAFNHMRACHRNYQVFYVGTTGTPQCAAIAMIPEPMETDPSLRVDLRTHDEKVRAAKASWQAWEKRIAALPFPQMKWAINGTLRGFLGEGTLWKDAKPTDTGRTVVAALRAMAA